MYQKVYVSPRPPPTISYQDKRTSNLGSDVARSSNIQRIKLKPNTQLSRTRRLVTKWSKEPLERTKFDRDTLNQEKHDNVTDSTSTGRPVCGHESTESCVLTPKLVERDQIGTERPVTVDQKEELQWLWTGDETGTRATRQQDVCGLCFLFSHYILWLVLDPVIVVKLLCQAGYVNENPSGSLSGNRSKRPSWRSGFSQAATLPTNKMLRISLCSTALTTLITYAKIILQHPDHRDSPIPFPGNLRGLKIRPTFWNELRHHCLLYGHGPNATSFIQDNSVPFLSVWYCRFQMMKSCPVTKNLTPQEQIYLLRGSRWALTKSWYSIFVDIHRATADFRGASEMRPATSSYTNSVNKHFATLSIVKRRLSIYNWNPGLRRGKRCLRETDCRKVAYHDLARGVRICWSRAFSRITSTWPITQVVQSSSTWGHLPPLCQCQIHLPSWHKTGFARSSHGRRTGMGLINCSFTCLISAITSDRPEVLCSALSLHISNVYAKKKSIAKKLSLTLRAFMISQEVDLVAGDFNGTAWRHRGKDNLSTTDEAFMDSILPTPLGPHHCGDLDPLWTIGRTSVDFSNHLALSDPGKWISTVHFPSRGKHLAWDRMIKAAIMKHGSIWISSIGATHGPGNIRTSHAFQKKKDPRLVLMEIPNDELARSWATSRSRRNCATICTWCSLFCETRVTIHSHRTIVTIRSMATTRTSLPSDLMTRLSQRDRRMPGMSCSFS